MAGRSRAWNSTNLNFPDRFPRRFLRGNVYGDRVKHGSMNAIYAAILLRGPVRIAGRRKSRRNWNWNFGGYDEERFKGTVEGWKLKIGRSIFNRIIFHQNWPRFDRGLRIERSIFLRF